MNYLVTTARLQMREMDPNDAEYFYHLNKDYEVMKYTGDVAFESIEASKVFLENYSDYRRNGFGRWSVELKNTGEVIGWCGLKLHDNGEVDLGYRLFRAHWGKGYATEASLACIDYGFNVLGLDRIIGRVARANLASIRVLEKCGMTYWKDEACEGIEDSIYYELYPSSS